MSGSRVIRLMQRFIDAWYGLPELRYSKRGLKELNDADFENLGMPSRASRPRDFAVRRYRR